jgi:hypothetical protein
VTLTTIPALIMRAWTASADLGIVRMNQTTSGFGSASAALSLASDAGVATGTSRAKALARAIAGWF